MHLTKRIPTTHRTLRGGRRFFLSAALTALVTASVIGSGAPVRAQTKPVTPQEQAEADQLQCSPVVVQQLETIFADRNSRTAAQQKMALNLLYAARVAKGQPAVAGMPGLIPSVTMLPGSKVSCSIKVPSTISGALLAAIKAAGGTVVYSSALTKQVSAILPVTQIETLAARSDVKFIAPNLPLRHANHLTPEQAQASKISVLAKRLTTSLRDRQARATPKLMIAAPTLTGLTTSLFPSLVKSMYPVNFDTEGYLGHQVDVASAAPYNMTGAGVKVGVISDDVLYLDQVQADGRLPAVGVPTGFSGLTDSGPTGEGTAMLGIVHDMAPDAQLFFASGFAGFADAITILRDTYGCDIILDDLGGADPVFSDGDVSQAVNHVVSEGAMYFSSAGNEGNVVHGDADCWEGDFSAGAALLAVGPAISGHVFSQTTVNAKTGKSTTTTSPYETAVNGTTNEGITILQWSDPDGTINSQYYIYTTDTTGATVKSVGMDDYGSSITLADTVNKDRIYVGLAGGVACALHVNRDQDGELGNRNTLSLVTVGQSEGHNASLNAFGVGAIDAGGNTKPFTTADVSQNFSSDGPRRMFYLASSTGGNVPVVSGSHTFASGGYTYLQKPDISAANGVTTDTPGFAPFYGTSAASPHAGAIAALVLSYGTKLAPKVSGDTTIIGRNLTPTEMRTVLDTSALNIEPANDVAQFANGYDVDSGRGILMPLNAVAYLKTFLDTTSIASVYLTPTSYRVTWTTELPSSSVVHYGVTGGTLNLIARGGTTTTNHVVTVPITNPNASYSFTVESATPTASVTYVGSASTAQTLSGTVKPAKSNVLLSNLALTRLADGTIQAVVTLTNTGVGAATDVTYTATLGGFSSTPISVDLGPLASKASASATLVFPTLTAATQQSFVLKGSDGVNTISSATLVTIPQ